MVTAPSGVFMEPVASDRCMGRVEVPGVGPLPISYAGGASENDGEGARSAAARAFSFFPIGCVWSVSMIILKLE